MVISGGVFYIFGSWAAAAASLVSGIFIDMDHLLDYFVNYGINFDFRKFYSACSEVRFKRLFLLLHSYEFLLIMWVLIYAMKLGLVWKGAAIGFTQHIVLDQLFNSRSDAKKLKYFFLYRLMKGFRRDAIRNDGKTF